MPQIDGYTPFIVNTAPSHMDAMITNGGFNRELNEVYLSYYAMGTDNYAAVHATVYYINNAILTEL